MKCLRIIVVVAIALATCSTARANEILNGGFESGTWGAWTVIPPNAGSILLVGGHGHTGRYAAWFGGIGSLDDQLDQTFATTPGENYVLDFWLGHSGSGGANEFTVSWNNAPLFTLINTGRSAYQHYSFELTATDWTTMLEFQGRDLLNFYYLDDVSVTPTPEPATVALLGTAMLLFVVSRRSFGREV